MKRFILCCFYLALLIIGIFAQNESIYIYRNNGSILSIPMSEIINISHSMYDVRNVLHDHYVTQVITTNDSTCLIPIAEVDSISFNAPDPAKSITAAYVPIDWETVEVVSSDTATCSYTLACSGEIPDIRSSSVIMINEDCISHVVLVTNVKYTGNNIEVHGVYGDLSYMFANTEFSVNYDKISNYGVKKTSNSTCVKDISIQQEYIKEIPATIELYKNGSSSVNVDYKTTIKLIPSFRFNFGDKIEDWKEGIKFIRAKNFSVDCGLTGEICNNADLIAEFNSQNSEIDLAPNNEDKYEFVCKLPTMLIDIPIGPVIIPAIIGGGIYKQVKLVAKSAHAAFRMGFDSKATGAVSFHYDGKSGKGSEPRLLFDFEKNPHYPTISGNVDLEAKIYLFPRIHFWICDYTGPSFDIKPYLSTEITGGFQKDLIASSPSDYCAWSLTNSAGVDWALGWSTSAVGFDWEASNKQLLTNTFTDNPWILYNSPERIGFLSANPTEISTGVPVDVYFEVLDKSFGKEIPTCLPQIVKFETEKGSVFGDDECFSYAKNGVVSARWIPGANSDVLYARLYDKVGNVIGEAHYGEPKVPKVVTGEVSRITKNSADVQCTFLNVPQGAECGVDYWTHGSDGTIGTKIISVNDDSQTYTVTLDGLTPNTEYSCSAFIRVGNEYYDGKEKEFTTPGSICPDDNHPHAIDLGLPSGTKWCCCNVGATTPKGFGGYYAWGETSTKSYFVKGSYDYFDEQNNEYIYIGSDIARTTYDVAYEYMGGSWQMPSSAMMKELINNCDRTWTQEEGVNGLLIIGKNGGQIFLPANGVMVFDEQRSVGTNGTYWSSTLDASSSSHASNMGFYMNDLRMGYGGRSDGRGVRAVCP